MRKSKELLTEGTILALFTRMVGYFACELLYNLHGLTMTEVLQKAIRKSFGVWAEIKGQREIRSDKMKKERSGSS